MCFRAVRCLRQRVSDSCGLGGNAVSVKHIAAEFADFPYDALVYAAGMARIELICQCLRRSGQHFSQTRQFRQHQFWVEITAPSQFREVVSGQHPHPRFAADAHGEAFGNGVINHRRKQIIRRGERRPPVPVEHGIVLGVGVAVARKEVEDEQSDKAQFPCGGHFDLRHPTHALLDPRTAVLLIFELRRHVQQLAEVLLMQTHGNAVHRLAVETG